MHIFCYFLMWRIWKCTLCNGPASSYWVSILVQFTFITMAFSTKPEHKNWLYVHQNATQCLNISDPTFCLLSEIYGSTAVFTRACHWPVHTIPPYFPKIHTILPFHLCLGLLSGLFLSGLPSKIFYAFLTSPMSATDPAQPILDLITLIICDEVYKSWSSSLCSLLQLPATSSLLKFKVVPALLF
jgi:hypothetical protein